MESNSRGLESWSLALQESKGSTVHIGVRSHSALSWGLHRVGRQPLWDPTMEKEVAGPEVSQVPCALPAAPVPYQSPTPWQPPCLVAPGSP